MLDDAYLGIPHDVVLKWIRKHYQRSSMLCFEAEEDNSSIALNAIDGSTQTDVFVHLQYSYDGKAWSDGDWDGHLLALAHRNDRVYIRASQDNTTGMKKPGSSKYHMFVMTGRIAAYGSIQHLLSQDGSREDVPTSGYAYLFKNCTSLTKAPDLPATTIKPYCYNEMFCGCSSLTEAPSLPAADISRDNAYNCYQFMFKDCISLVKAPELPSLTLSNKCYYNMFNCCTSLVKAPDLPAHVLVDNCYSGMFYKCARLSSVDVSFSEWTPQNATRDWLKYTGTDASVVSREFRCSSELMSNTTERTPDTVPSTWTMNQK